MSMGNGKKTNRQGKAKDTPVGRAAGQRASVAQVLLVARLRVRNRRDLAVDSLDHAARMIFVTCKSWFFPDRAADAEVADEAPTEAAAVLARSDPDKPQGEHAHRQP